MTTYIIPIIAVILAAIFIAVLLISKSTKKSKRRYKAEKLTDGQFETAKRKMKPYCSKEDFDYFMNFLRKYEGGYIRWQNGNIIHRDYLGKEKGDLKGIFYNIIAPNPNLSVEDKENFRAFILSVGVTGVEERPAYEIRDSKLKNKETDEDDYIRKEVGNIGENNVRNILGKLNSASYYVINGPVLKSQDTAKEFDHIVIGSSGVFIIETKAFGMTDGKSSEATLFIDKGDKWIIRKSEKNSDKELKSPTEQIMAEKTQIDSIIYNAVDVQPLLVLSNTKLKIKQNIDLPYKVLRIDRLLDYIKSSTSKISSTKKKSLLAIIDETRVN